MSGCRFTRLHSCSPPPSLLSGEPMRTPRRPPSLSRLHWPHADDRRGSAAPWGLIMDNPSCLTIHKLRLLRFKHVFIPIPCSFLLLPSSFFFFFFKRYCGGGEGDVQILPVDTWLPPCISLNLHFIVIMSRMTRLSFREKVQSTKMKVVINERVTITIKKKVTTTIQPLRVWKLKRQWKLRSVYSESI